MAIGSRTSGPRWTFVLALALAAGLTACDQEGREGPLGPTIDDYGMSGAVIPDPPPPVQLGLVDNGDGTFTYTHDVTSGYAFGGCRWYNQDSGWTHVFPDYATPGRTILSARLTVVAWDVDSEPYHGWYGEYDGVFVDGVQLNPGYLQGRNNTWSTTHFDIPVSRITDDGRANIWINIDMHNTGSWCTQMGRSTLTLVYRDGPVNHPPFQPVLSLTPEGAPSVDADLGVTVTGPDPADPDGHGVTYRYRWFLNTGTGGFLDPQVHGRGVISGSTVPASATRINDQWRVEVTPVDELGAIGDFAVATFPTVTQVVNHPPQAAIQLLRGPTCPDPYLEGGHACINGGSTFDPDQDISTLSFHWDFGDGATMEWQGVQGFPPHVYADDGTYVVTLTVVDDHGASDVATAEVVVANVAPSVDAEPDATVNWGEAYQVTATFSDPGLQDGPWSWTVDWGDGSSSEGTVAEPNALIHAENSYFAVGSYTVTACVTDKDGGQGCDATAVEVVDPTPPVVTYELAGTEGTNEWFTSEVLLSWTVEDPESPLTVQGCEGVTEGGEGHHAYTCSATSAGGATTVTAEFKIDQTPPVVTYAGNAGVYDIADQVAITCSASDEVSGLASHDCFDLYGAAWEFGLGESTFSATAMDNAGLHTLVEGAFTVESSYGGLCTLVETWVSHRGVANSLCAKLRAAGQAADRGNYGARDGSLGAFINEVEAQTGKKVPAEKASLLVRFALALME